MERLIDSLELPAGLRDLKEDALEQVCHELRDELISVMSNSSGHFASSLGATEITVAIHSVFDTPADRLVWDVGHQGYIHKMVTGRREQLPTIRKKDGISGFLRRDESEYDCFGAGHAGTSISSAVGMALALSKSNSAESKSDRSAVAVIGDGSLTAGMAFEALNHAGSLGLKNLVVILNDNEMSISPNVGALSWLFSRTITGETSTAARKQFKEWHAQGYIPDFVYKAIDRAEEAAQGYFSQAAVLFEAFGFRYIGPVDGHSVSELRAALKNARLQDCPVIVHARTKKGKGYDAAEADPLKWHAVKPFDREKAEFKKSNSSTSPAPQTYTKVFSDTVLSLAKADEKIIGITAAMPTGTGLDQLESELPDQFLDVGISEQHAVTCAAGLACEGYKPICAIYSTFLQRGYDQVIHDVCIQNLPVVLALDRAGAVGNDGETHQGLFDISYLRAIPNITLMAPKDENELRHMIYSAMQYSSPVAIRYPRGGGVGVDCSEDLTLIERGTAEIIEHGSELLLLGLGQTVHTAKLVAQEIAHQYGFTPTVVNTRFVKPLDSETLTELIYKHKYICTIEDHALIGGFGSAVLELSQENNLFGDKEFIRLGAHDYFTPHGSQAEQYEMHGYDVKGVVARLQKALGKKLEQRLSA